MRRCATRAILLLAAIGANAPAAARSPFDGRWVAELDTQAGLATDVYLVTNGTYRCDSCRPPRAYPADGRPHSVAGATDIISEAVTISGPRTIVTRIESPTLHRVTTMTVAADDATATYVSDDRRPGVRGPLHSVYLARRAAPAPAGAHPVSGSWQGVRYVSVPEQVRTTELHVDGNRLTYRHPLGYSFSAVFGGGFVPVRGPYRTPVFAAVRRLGARTIEETRRSGDKIVLVRTYTLATDGRSLTIASTEPGAGQTFRITAHRK
jgi:hypothetical protein